MNVMIRFHLNVAANALQVGENGAERNVKLSRQSQDDATQAQQDGSSFQTG